MSRFKPITVSAKSGGRLAMDISSNELGVANYRVKRDWRRYQDREIRREGHDYFRPNRSVALGDQCLNAGAPVNLIYGAKAENGRRAAIAGTSARLYRYFWDGDYAEQVGAFYYVTPTGSNTPYAEDGYFLDSADASDYFEDDYVREDYSGWSVIGQNFSAGGYRWEALNVGDDVIFNNGVDLPQAYGLNEFEAVPLYELREQGVASVGTIAEFNGILKCADILQIKESKMAEIFSPVALAGTAEQVGAQSSGISHATQAQDAYVVNIVSGAFVFDAGMIGKTLRFQNGFSGEITAYTSPTQVTLDRAPGYVGEVLSLELATDESIQTITVKPGKLYVFTATHGTLTNGTDTVRTGEYFIAAGSTVSASGSNLSLKRVFYPASGNNDQPFVIINAGDTDSTVTATEAVFDASMVGLKLFWDTGEVRQIISVLSATEVVVENDSAIPSGKFSIENTMAYGPITDPSLVDRRQYRVLWSSLGQARRFAAELPCSMKSGSRMVELDYPVKSFSAGQDVLVVGAGLNGGNLLGTIVYVTPGRNRLVLDTKALTTVVDSQVQAADMIGSIASFEDLEEDGSKIIRMLDLNGQLVIYRDGGYQLCIYNPSFDTATGTVITAFQYSKLVKTSNTLFYKHSLITATQGGNNFHLFAGRNSFYRFDMISRVPTPWDAMELNNRTFFDAVNSASTFTGPASQTLRVMDYVWAADNALTQEIVFGFPGHATEKAFCFDYATGTMSTTGADYSAGTAMVKPSEDDMAADENWFVTGTLGGVLLQYGRADRVQSGWEDSAMWSRLGEAYASELYSGLGHFNVPTLEKDINLYTLELSSFSDDYPIVVSLYGAKNPNSKRVQDRERLLGTRTFSTPSMGNTYPCHFKDNYLADRIVVSGKDNPVELSARTFRVAVLDSAGQVRLG